jgi:hypothetical protein
VTPCLRALERRLHYRELRITDFRFGFRKTTRNRHSLSGLANAYQGHTKSFTSADDSDCQARTQKVGSIAGDRGEHSGLPDLFPPFLVSKHRRFDDSLVSQRQPHLPSYLVRFVRIIGQTRNPRLSFTARTTLGQNPHTVPSSGSKSDRARILFAQDHHHSSCKAWHRCAGGHGAEVFDPNLLRWLFNYRQIAQSSSSSPRILPDLETGRSSRTSSILAAVIQALIHCFTHIGTAAVRSRPPLPRRSIITHLPSRSWLHEAGCLRYRGVVLLIICHIFLRIISHTFVLGVPRWPPRAPESSYFGQNCACSTHFTSDSEAVRQIISKEVCQIE